MLHPSLVLLAALTGGTPSATPPSSGPAPLRAQPVYDNRQAPPPRPTRVAPPVRWDSSGWILLGEHQVQGRRDRDIIDVGRRAGDFDRLTLVVQDGDVEMLGMLVRFADRTTYAPPLRHYFREGGRTTAIDLPGRGRAIRTIELSYGRARGGGRAVVQVWGRARAAERPSGWAAQGWVPLGRVSVRGGNDHDTIRVGERKGTYRKLMLVVERGEVEVDKMVVTFDNGRKQAPAMKHLFREGSRNRPVDLQGNDRFIDSILLNFGKSSGDAIVEVWGKEGDGVPSTAPRPIRAQWDNRGWQRIGEQQVGGSRDRDIIVLRGNPRYSRLMLVVEDSDLELNAMVVKFRNGERYTPNLRARFSEGSRTRSIDLPGAAREIEHIELRYGNLPGGGRASVQVWGR
jgi:hypothetical protein